MPTKKIKSLLIIDHAPDYRENFLRELGKRVDLTVVAQPCESAGLTGPDIRKNYSYIEIPAIHFMGFFWQQKLDKILRRENWDVVCCDLNLRHLSRLFLFLSLIKIRAKWVWRGHIFGRNKSFVYNWIKKYLLASSAGCLAYSEPIAKNVITKFKVSAISFNNTQVRKNDFRDGKFNDSSKLRLLFVGRNQPRKKLERLVNIAEQNPQVCVRLIGPEMNSLEIPANLEKSRQVRIFGRTVGKNLDQHFDWADLVANPGHVGLLVMNASMHGKGIVIDSDSQHAPEYYLAKESGQPFIPFGNQNAVSQFIDDVLKNRWKLQYWGQNLQKIAKNKYTIEYMADAHYKMFKNVAFGKRKGA